MTRLFEVGPAEMGLARSASCRPDGGLAFESGRKGGRALLLSDGREDQWTKSVLVRPESATAQNPPSGVV